MGSFSASFSVLIRMSLGFFFPFLQDHGAELTVIVALSPFQSVYDCVFDFSLSVLAEPDAGLF